jgi:hypothetical protein
MQTDDLRWSAKRAEHEHDATVFPQVGDRFHPAADEIGVGNRRRPQHAEGAGRAFGREIDVTVGIIGRGGHEKHRLPGQPLLGCVVDDVVNPSHERSFRLRGHHEQAMPPRHLFEMLESRHPPTTCLTHYRPSPGLSLSDPIRRSRPGLETSPGSSSRTAKSSWRRRSG